MKKLFIALFFIGSVHAKGVAWMPNQAGGKIVLTDEVCKDNKGKVYKALNKLYMYTEAGYTQEGCFYISDETVKTIWSDGNEMRYPIENFTIYQKKETSL
jgi:hypothetical protein